MYIMKTSRENINIHRNKLLLTYSNVNKIKLINVTRNIKNIYRDNKIKSIRKFLSPGVGRPKKLNLKLNL